ncbi:MAG: IS4 family transposase [Azoarcus sp.]|nr:IS4 family transposase [Azoarcus sp.]
MRAVPIVWAVQDTTFFNGDHPPETQGLGPIAEKGRGLLSHGTLAVTPEHWPLGLLAQHNWVREDKGLSPHKKRAIADKESCKWLKSIEALAAAREAAPETTWVSVGDREADGFEWFAMARPVGVEWLVRASWNRVVESEHRHWWETLQASREAGTVELKGPRRPGKPPRTCPLSVRHQRLTIPAPRTRKPLGEVHLWGILATEISPPDGETPIEGLLLTSVPTSCLDEAIERLHGYSCRWRIEVWHRVLKTGGRIESRPLETIERLSGALTLYSIVAWRIL